MIWEEAFNYHTKPLFLNNCTCYKFYCNILEKSKENKFLGLVVEIIISSYIFLRVPN